jgi:hypothetical protein
MTIARDVQRVFNVIPEIVHSLTPNLPEVLQADCEDRLIQRGYDFYHHENRRDVLTINSRSGFVSILFLGSLRPKTFACGEIPSERQTVP